VLHRTTIAEQKAECHTGVIAPYNRTQRIHRLWPNQTRFSAVVRLLL